MRNNLGKTLIEKYNKNFMEADKSKSFSVEMLFNLDHERCDMFNDFIELSAKDKNVTAVEMIKNSVTEVKTLEELFYVAFKLGQIITHYGMLYDIFHGDDVTVGLLLSFIEQNKLNENIIKFLYEMTSIYIEVIQDTMSNSMGEELYDAAMRISANTSADMIKQVNTLNCDNDSKVFVLLSASAAIAYAVVSTFAFLLKEDREILVR